jgi:transcriptional regulator with XRE-family HTH domain
MRTGISNVNELGSLLIKLRQRAGLSQSQVAERSQLSGGYISQLESGARGERIPRVTLQRLAEALGANPNDLYSAAGLRINSNNIAISDRPRLEDFIQTEPTLNDDEKSFLLNLIGYFRASRSSE